MTPAIWPGWIDASSPLILLGDVNLIRTTIVDLCARLEGDEPMPGVPASLPTLPASPLVISTAPDVMRTALVAAGVEVLVVQCPRGYRNTEWEALEPAIAGADLVIVDDIAGIATTHREVVSIYIRVMMRARAALLLGEHHDRITHVRDVPADWCVCGISTDDDGRLVVGQRPRVGRRAPAPLVGTMCNGRVEWTDALTAHRLDRLALLQQAR